MEWFLIIHAGSTFFMAGLCWFVQIVHYPLFHQIGLQQFPLYEKKNFVTAFIAVPVMAIEFTTGLYLLYHNIESIYFLNAALMVIIGLSTMLLQVPIHFKLMKKASSKLIRKLILTNWIRTLSWSIRIILIGILLSRYLEFEMQ
ncbi:MAG: hypothetical protein ACI923_001628 [Flavobacteriales bacterium]|jgi:hypothetical protein